MNKSNSTINRYFNQLLENGYVVVENSEKNTCYKKHIDKNEANQNNT